MYCPKCGAENVEGVQFCQSCSGALDWSETPAVTEPAKTSRLAIASLVLAILSPLTCLVTAIPALITGIISLIKIKKSEGRQKGRSLAIAGLVITAILVPVSFYVKGQVLGLVCGTNLRGLSNAINVYTFENNDKYPTGSQWCDLLIKHTDIGLLTLVCKGVNQGQSNYAINANAVRLGKDAPYDMVLMFECATGWNQVGGPELLTTENHRGSGCNILFVDLHVEFIKTEDLDSLRWTVEQGDHALD